MSLDEIIFTAEIQHQLVDVTIEPAEVLVVVGENVGPQGPRGYGILPSDSVVAASSTLITNKLLGGDPQPAWRVMGDGRIDWGDGANPPDITLGRAAAGVLSSSQSLQIGGTIKSGFVNGGGFIYNPPSTNKGWALYSSVQGESTLRTGIFWNGDIYWGPGTSAADTILYRSDVSALSISGSLATTGRIASNDGIVAKSSSSTLMYIGDVGGYPGIYFGSAYDSYVYRSQLKLLMSNSVIGTTHGGRHAYFGNAYNAGNLWLGSYFAGSLRWDEDNSVWSNDSSGGNNGWAMMGTDGASGGLNFFTDAATGGVNRSYTPAQIMTLKKFGIGNDGKIYIGQGISGDTYLLRQTVSTLRLPGDFIVDKTLVTNWGSSTAQVFFPLYGGIEFGSARDTAIARSSANTLRTANLEIGTTPRAASENLRIGTTASKYIAFNFSGAGAGGGMGEYSRIDFGGPNGSLSASITLETDGGSYNATGLKFYTIDGGGNPVRTLILKDGKMYLGAEDPPIYRAYTRTIALDGWLKIGTNTPSEGITFIDSTSTGYGGIWRSSATGMLTFKSQNSFSFLTQGGGALYISDATAPATDVGLYRYAAGILRTVGKLFSAVGLGIHGPSHTVEYTADLGGNLGGTPAMPANSILVWIDGTQYKIPVYP